MCHNPQTGAENPVCADRELCLQHWLTPADISEQCLCLHVQHFLWAAEAWRDRLLLPVETSRTQSVRTSAKWISSTFWDWFLSSGHLIVGESCSQNQRHSNNQHNRAEVTLVTDKVPHGLSWAFPGKISAIPNLIANKKQILLHYTGKSIFHQ